VLLHYLAKHQYQKTSKNLKHASSMTNHKVVQLHVWDMVGYSVITSLRIYCWICWWNSYQNLWTFGKVTGKKWLTDHSSYAKAFCCNIFMAALCNRGHYIFALWFLSIYRLSSFFSSPNLSGRRLDVYHTLTHGVSHLSTSLWMPDAKKKQSRLPCKPLTNGPLHLHIWGKFLSTQHFFIGPKTW